MNKRKNSIIKKIIILLLIVIIFQSSSPIYAASSKISSLYSNPNQNSNTYKFKISDVINSSVMTSVIGCTGVVNRVSKWMSKLIQSPGQRAKIIEDEIHKVRTQLENACSSTKGAAELASGVAPWVNDIVTPVNTFFTKISVSIDNAINGEGLSENSMGPKGNPKTKEEICVDKVKNLSPDVLEELAKQTEQEAEKNFKEQCFDGIAITLAKNQLTAMTRSTMNWVNSGYGGNPLFVQNMKNLTYNLEKNVINTGVDILLAPENVNPYAADFARSTIESKDIMSSSSKFLGGLQSDLGNFVTDPNSYYTEGQLNKAEDTRTVLQRAQDANNAFANDFATGGWAGWLALTQRENNNPLGFNMVASQYLSDMQANVVSDTKNEVTQNNGFLNQKECIKWQMYNKDSSPKKENIGNVAGTGLIQPEGFVFVTEQPQYQIFDNKNEYGICVENKVITPGSLIKDKVSNYLDSPERQLELVKTINDSLNSLFSALISKLEGGGLSGLSDAAVDTNWTDSMNELATDSATNTTYDNNGAYDGFNLTRDMGNTYLHIAPINLGTWNANTNNTNDNKKLYPDTAPGYYNTEGKFTPYGNNSYYIVSNSGNTKLINEGYNGWVIGDKAFWNGTEWQNWKKEQTDPIKNRGVIQIQEDYIVAGKEILKILPNIMPKLGELDYCIPGPNPSYKTNSMDAQSAYQDWINSIYVGPINYSDTDRLEWSINRESSQTYKTMASIFDDNPNVWKTLTGSNAVAWFLNYFGPFTNTKNEGIASYSYKGDLSAKYEEAVNLQTINTNYVNKSLFQNFYEVFDKMMSKVYFENMTNKYLETENSTETKPNPGYLPMATSGLDLTKNIIYYNDDTAKATQDYTEAIAQAKINIAKLEPIKDEVSTIIKAAQDRRNKELEDILGLTQKEIKVKYAKCFDEENLSFYDADTIIKNTGLTSQERCNDGIDNDMDGLVDGLDPDCSAYKNTNSTSGNDSNAILTHGEKTTKNICGKNSAVVVTPTASASIVYNFLGIASEDIANGEMGNIVIGGLISGIDTSHFVKYVNEPICLSTTIPGALTEDCKSKSITASNSLLVGDIVDISPTNGSIAVKSSFIKSIFIGGGDPPTYYKVKAGENIKKGEAVSASDYIKATNIIVVKKAIGV